MQTAREIGGNADPIAVRINEAIERIEAALARMEGRHRVLRKAAAESIDAMDQLIASAALNG